MKILTLVSVYLPGYKSGGPVRTIAGMVEQMGDAFDFWIITSDRDLGDTDPYPGIPADEWVSVGKAHVQYVDMDSFSIRKLSKLVRDMEPEIVYLNSLFSPLNYKYLLARRMGVIPQIPTLIAPRGVFSPGAFRLKRTKKRVFMYVAQTCGLLKGVCWQVSSERERNDTLSAVSGIGDTEIFVAADLASAGDLSDSNNAFHLGKMPGHGRFIFISRISAKKNLENALSMLSNVRGRIRFDIYGPIEDLSYWDRCSQAIAMLPQNVSVHVHGAIPHEEVGEALSKAHFFFFPTWGENFGHVIIEALRAGRPVLISDQTPWNALPESSAGWVIPLAERDQWTAVLQHCVDMSDAEFAHHSESARRYAWRWLASSAALEANKAMFLALGAQTAVQPS